MMQMYERVGDIFKRMSHAAMAGGRPPDAARLVAVSKTMPAEAVREAYDCGLRMFGESRVQEAIAKAEALADLRSLTWHLIGHLQKNKVKAAVALFDLIHSVDSPELLEAINRHAAEAGKVQDVLLQVKLSTEEAKHGATEQEVRAMAAQAGEFPNVRILGLMTMPPLFDNPQDARPYFKRLYEINSGSGGLGLPELSMGMTGDFEVAIKEGATLVRIGSAIFDHI